MVKTQIATEQHLTKHIDTTTTIINNKPGGMYKWPLFLSFLPSVYLQG